MSAIKYYIVRGSVRGTISRHRIEDRAHLAAIRDRKQCRRLGGGAYSDVQVYAINVDGDAMSIATPDYLADRT